MFCSNKNNISDFGFDLKPVALSFNPHWHLIRGSLTDFENKIHKNSCFILTLSLRRHLNNAPSCYTEHYKI